ncbi:MAG: ABC transporter ATP-binding protein [Mariprofundaceae bacterium]|nr:ABC transporter ATP-binding protein [Mariprofundaceae bacterium]
MMQVRNVCFEYPQLRALNQVSLDIRKGTITALVGPNGAGKSTLLRILAVLTRPFSGSVKINACDVFLNPREAHRNIGFLPDFFGLYDSLTVKQCLTYFALAHGLPRLQVSAAVTRASDLLQLTDRMMQEAGSLSRGLRQRLAIAQAIVHQPQFLLLDEPASGLDPEARHSLADVFLRLKKEGVTLLVSSHILSELDAYCDDMIVLRQGKIVDHQHNTLQNHAQLWLALELLTPSATARQDAINQIKLIANTGAIHETKTGVRFLFDDDAHKRQQLLRTLIAHEVPVLSFYEYQSSLQDAYLATQETP